MEFQRLDIVQLINNSPITKLSNEFQTKLLTKIKDSFTDDQQQLFVASFYCYLNYNSNDFIIDLDDVWKWCGFARKDHSKRLLEKHFTIETDYKILFPQLGEKGACPGRPQETVLMTVNTFKKFCLKAGTKKANEIHDYYLKLEEILQDTMREESNELRSQIEEKNKLLLEKDKLLEDLENKPETEGFNSRESGEIYCIRDTSKPGHLKIGIANKSVTRVDQLNVASSTHSLELYTKFETFDRILAEKLIHHSLHPFRIKNRKEWFYFKDDLELAYAINTIKRSLEYINTFDIKNYKHFKESIKDIDINSELIKKEITKELQIEHVEKIKEHIDKIKNINKNSIQQSTAQTGNFKGACWITDKQLWKSQLQNNYNNVHLGYFSDEIDAAKAYNDYAAYLNENENTNFLLNDIPGYKTVPRNIPELNKIEIQMKKSSKYNGVSYDSKRKIFVSSIKLSKKTYNLGSSYDEIECAKLYNQQALYFNNTFNTNYILNDIENYVNVPKDIYKEIQDNCKNKKTSKYHGVSLTRANKWECSYMINNKKNHIGTFETELEACEAYNKKVTELNKNGCNYKINEMN
jgi:hypothetical protein